MSLTYSKTIPFGEPAHDFSLPGIDNKTHTLATYKNAKILVIIFMCNHCPYVQACWDRLIAIQDEFGPRGVQLIGINSNDATNHEEDGFDYMKVYAAEHGQNFPYLCDASQEVARDYGAACTPDIFVYDEARELQYHGRIDDNWREEERVLKRELALALETLLRGKKPNRDQNPSMGCNIKWKD